MKPEKQLYQWDVNQYLTGINPAAQYVDYKIGNEVIRIKADGTRCRIPDEVLQTYGGKTCYERYPDGTYRAYSFTVLYAPKPPDYVYTPDGAIGEFRKVVDTATIEYNDNHNLKLAKYDTNAEQHTTDYNRNAEQKLEAYNQNHTEKVAEYNQNAETKTAEFDANAAALQTEVDRLQGECDTLAAENRKQENRISALMKLNKGQTYDILPEEGETASRTAPSGAKYVSVDKVGGKSVVWNQLVDGSNLPSTRTINGITFTNNGDGSITVDGTATENANLNLQRMDNTTTIGHKYLMLGGAAGGSISTYFYRYDSNGGTQAYDFGNGAIFTKTAEGSTYITIRVVSGVKVSGLTFNPQLVDLTLMFGAGNEPTIKQFTAMFPADSYPYNPGEIISSRTETITAGTEAITTGFQELRSALAAHDYIDMDGGTIQRNIGAVDLGTLTWDINGTFEDGNVQFIARVPGRAWTENGLCDKFEKSDYNVVGTYALRTTGDQITFVAPEGTEINAFIESVNGATLYYELATPTTEPVTIPESLQEWHRTAADGVFLLRRYKTMDINFISDFFVPRIVALSLCVGYVMRNFLPTDNKWIPLALLIIGAVSGVVVSGFNFSGIVSGAVSGLAAVGLNQVFKQALGLNVRPDIELTDEEVQEHELNEEEDDEEEYSDDDQQAEE